MYAHPDSNGMMYTESNLLKGCKNLLSSMGKF